MVDSYDVAVVGGGPAGGSAAAAAARAGASVVLLERAGLPRYKTCGGGLIGPTLGALPGAPPVRATVTRASFTLRGGRAVERSEPEPLLFTAARTELDHWLAREAVAAGAELRTGCQVTGVDDGPEHAVVTTDDGVLHARTVVAADGTSSRLARAVGVRLSRVDLGLELELDAGPLTEAWADRIHLDWGPLPGSYGWVFPKGDSLTVGVITAKGRPAETRRYLADLVDQQGLDGLRVLHDSGHLTRCRAPGSPLGRGRVVLAGDAAGLLEPWTREGISFAVRSGIAAGTAAAAGATGLQQRYAAGVADLVEEMAAGETCLRAFERRPAAFHALIGRTPVGWRQFVRLTRGDTTLARALTHRSVRLGLGVLGAGFAG
ncbi:geranylgeranyl reductase family protein [Nocardioides sp. SYSU D00038]|uniref:geranylgeranyl reductase family protein n=1 Tax=Nocardioides sp. SYSU D00038 TaxID=2812554 RepID=UPI0019688FBA|nr:geranylgeranyl reductase family protein [Nocardioides sp. SYSU D00038]